MKMFLNNNLTFDFSEIISDIPKSSKYYGSNDDKIAEDEELRWLIQEDNLIALKQLYKMDINPDLIYADPPFATGRIFNTGDTDDGVKQFSNKGVKAYDDQLDGVEYFQRLINRLVLSREVLSENGSIYVHVDNSVGAYVKVLMDEIFGQENHQNTITRIKCNPKNFKRDAYGNQSDIILFYTRSGNHIWNDPRQEFTEEQLDELYPRTDDDGRRFTTSPLHAPGETEDGCTGDAWNGVTPPNGRHWSYKPRKLTEMDKKGRIYWSRNGNPREKRYADEADGAKQQDVWEFKDPQSKQYPTGKNLDMLKMIVEASSEEDSLVLDPYCGGGTTLMAADQLDRDFIGIDVSDEAIKVTTDRVDCTSY
jgi:adenine-specific DNA-methyltransferase